MRTATAMWMAAALALGGCAKDKDPKGGDQGAPRGAFTLDDALAGLAGSGPVVAEISTELGVIQCELMPGEAPETVASFVGLARGLRAFQDPLTRKWEKRPFFDELAFHRVIPTFMIQGGDPLSREYGHPLIGTGTPGYTLPDELKPGLNFDRPGRLAMANGGPRTHTGGSQFFITEAPRPDLDGGYVIFGQCDNEDAVRAIARVPRDSNDKPRSPVTMRVRIYRR